jgi:hypothetical protein
MRRNKTGSTITAILLAIFAVVGVNAAGPLNMWNYEQRIPYRWDVSSPVKIYTDNGPFEVVAAPYTAISNETADGIVAFAANQWSSVPTSSFRAEVAGDFASIGLPDASDAATAAQVIGPDNGGGLHVIYDAVPSGTYGQGKIMKDFFGAPPNVLGIASPEFADEATGTITEGWMILNAQQRWVGDDQLLNFAGVFTHEMGHAINLAHSQTNGAITLAGDTNGPKSCGTTLPYATTVTKNDVETMYPFANIRPITGGGVEQSTVEQADDKASISNLYPAPGYMESRGSIKGRILQTDGTTGITGINVIARNLDNPYVDAVSAMSGDYVRVAAGDDGSYTLNGLTPGARYAVYTDLIVKGGFPTNQPLYVPEGEEFYNGANESGNGITDDRCQMDPITAVAGSTTTADIVLNTVKGAPKFTPMYPGAYARTVSSDGRVVGGGINPGGTFRYTEEGGYEVLDQTFGTDGRMSRDGQSFVSSTVAPNGKNIASVLTLGSNWRQLPLPAAEAPAVLLETCDDLSSGSRISADGKTVGGLAYVDTNGSLPGERCKARPFVWSAESGSKFLPAPLSMKNVRINGISNDLSTIAGFHDTFGFRMAVRWIDGRFEEFSTPEVPVGEAMYVTPDGRMITGGNAGLVQNPWTWTRDGGLVQMARVAPYFSAYSLAASDDGKVVAGLGGSRSQFAGDASGQRAFLWTKELGSVDFENFLQAQGTYFEGWILYSNISMSADGTIQVGSGAGPRGGAGWIVDMTKVNVCHAPPGNPGNTQTINVPFVGNMADHLKHGDTIGVCVDAE